MDVLHYSVRNIQSLVKGRRSSGYDLHQYSHFSDDVSDNQVSNKHHNSDVELLNVSGREQFVTTDNHN